MYIPIQKNIYCEQCKDCGSRPVVEQMPKGKFRVLCPNCKEKNAMKAGFVEVEKWNLVNAKSAVLRKVG